MRRAVPVLLTTLLTTAVSCNGNIGGDGGAASGQCEVTATRVGLQRLTRAEYNRTVRDLFGVTSAPADSFPPDSATSGFDNNAKSLTTSPQLARLLLTAAESVATEAIANGASTIVTCDPQAEADCARSILERLALRVYRRPANDTEIDGLVALTTTAQGEGESFESAVAHAMTAMLMAPQFLYRGVPIEASVDGGDVEQLDDYALATRLSYFLWGSTPDDQLLAAATSGTLRQDLHDEFERMLADSKSNALYESFVTQWLQLGKLDAATPDPTLYPSFDASLRAAMREETRLFFQDMLARDASPLEIITGQATFANASLATVYGASGPSDAAFTPVSLDPIQRAGMLTMPAILTMTSNPDEPNIVRRGVWLAEVMLCADPPPPPEGVPLTLEDAPSLRQRERLAAHRADPSCASCHDLIDPLGFAFERYDAIGQWRGDRGDIDAQGTLPDGRPFDGMIELSSLLAESSEFSECLTEKVATYALGRTMSHEEACVVADIAANNVTASSSLSDLLWAIVASDAFQTQAIEK